MFRIPVGEASATQFLMEDWPPTVFSAKFELGTSASTRKFRQAQISLLETGHGDAIHAQIKEEGTRWGALQHFLALIF